MKDSRALQDPRAPSGLRNIGCYYALLDSGDWDPTFVIDVIMNSTVDGQLPYRLSVYLVDYDKGSRHETVELFDRWSLDRISPVQDVASFETGTWLSWVYSGSVRLRFNFIRGSNHVVSALMFDQQP